MSIVEADRTATPNEPDPAPTLDAYYSPWGYIRVMFLIAWSAFRHPFTTTYINLETGETRQQEQHG